MKRFSFPKRKNQSKLRSIPEDKLISAITTVLMLGLGGTFALCQTAFLRIPLGDSYFHSLLLLLPFVAAPTFVRLPVYLLCTLIVAIILFLRVQVMPVDFYDLLFSNIAGALTFLCGFGLLIWFIRRGVMKLFDRWGWQQVSGAKSIGFLVVTIFCASFAISTLWFFYLYAIFSAYGYGEYIATIAGGFGTPEFWGQVIFDWVTWTAAILVVQAMAQQVHVTRVNPPIQMVFQRWLMLVVAAAFLFTTSVDYLFSSRQALAEARSSMTNQVEYFLSQAQSRSANQQPIDDLLASYSSSSGEVIAILESGRIVSTNNWGYSEEMLGDMIGEFASYEEAYEQLTSTSSLFLQTSDGGITYFKAGSLGKFLAITFTPSARVFANRAATILLNTLCYLVLHVIVFLIVARLLTNVVVKGFKRTNHTLALITQGDLEQRVEEHDTLEFVELSDGINTTVDALKDLIGEAERRMERDLATAKAIQESALPRVFPPFPEVGEFEIFASMNAAKEVGGDFFDFFLIDERTLGFLIADVSGKGIPGALFMMAAKAELENYMGAGMDLAEAVSKANQILCANNDAGMFVTVWAGSLDYTTGELTYVNAGHNFPLLRHGEGGAWEWLTEKCGLFLGTFETAKYRTERLALQPGDELLLYTDGVNEAFSARDEEYGNDRLEAFLGEHAQLGPEELVPALRASVAAWAEGAEQSDDITILALEYKGPGSTR